MGSGIEITCDNCGYQCDALLGIGMMYSDLRKLLHLFHFSRRSIIQQILDEHDVQDTHYEHKAYRCEKCGQFHERFYAKIEYDGNKTYETVFKCPKCRKKLEDVGYKDIAVYPCPSCRKKTLTAQETISWD